MPVQVASFIIPKNGEQWYILEDKFIKGGLQIVANTSVRDAIVAENRKAGMLIVVQSDFTLWQLGSDLTTWTNLQIGGIEGPTGPTGDTGPQGKSLYDVWLDAGNNGTEAQFFETLRGLQGIQGVKGDTGETGASAYAAWLDAGNVGNEAEFIVSISGDSAFEVWKAIEGNENKTQTDFFNSITGKSSYQFWLDLGNEGTIEEFLQTNAGKSALDVWHDAGGVGDENAFIEALKGADGQSLHINAVGAASELVNFTAEQIGFAFLDEDNAMVYVKKSMTSPFWTDPIPFTTGIAGPEGPQGAPGAVGKSSYQEWIDNGNPGGTVEQFLLSLKGPKGDQGDAGPQGLKGDTGEIGPQGNEGAPGLQGEKGDQGDAGPQGIQGIKGDKGDQGETGAQGLQGIQGVQGIKGDKGDTGDQGLQGVKGDTGETGAQGASAYAAWIAAGNVGDEAAFIASIKGVKGDTGDTGAQGIQGEKGDKGDTGDVGPQGPAGTVTNNIYANLAGFPAASGVEGMFAVADDTNKAYFASDGVWVELAIEVTRVIPYDLSFTVPGNMPTADEIVGGVVVPRQIVFNQNAPGSFAKAKTAPAGTATYKLMKNGVQIGSISFAAAATVGTITTTANVTLDPGDILEVVAPSVVDASIKDVMITIVGRAEAPQLSMAFT